MEVQNREMDGDESRLIITKVWVEGKMGNVCPWAGVLFGVMKMFWNQTVAMVAQLCEYTRNHWVVYFKRLTYHM